MNWSERFRWVNVRYRQVALVVFMSIGVTFSEMTGMAMLLPVFEFLDNGKDIAPLVESTKRWQFLSDLYGRFNLPVTLMSLMLPVFVLIFLRQAAMYAKQVYCANVQYQILRTVQGRAFSAFITADYSFSRDRSPGQLINLMMTDGQRSATAMQFLFELIATNMMVCGYIFLFWLVHGWPALLAAGILLAVAFAVRRFIKISRFHGRRISELNEQIQMRLVELFSGIRLVKLSCREKDSISQISVILSKMQQQLVLVIRTGGRMRLLFEPTAMLILLGILFFAVEMMDMSLAGLSLLGIIVIRMVPLARAALDTRQAMHAYFPSFENVQKLVTEAEAASVIRGGDRSFTGLKRELKFENVTYRYPTGVQDALKEVNLSVPANSMTALVGHSGAGKSTIVDLVPRLIDPIAGRITADGVDLKEYRLDELRRQVAFVSQEAVIFDDTVENNIRYAIPDASTEAVVAAAKAAHADGFISELAQGYQTRLGERGARLSVGQRQRISLARALLQKASILILDEPTSALDSETERGIQKSLEQLRKEGKTTIIAIAHRLSTIYRADQIVVFDGGRTVECGTHAQLMHNDDWYARVLSMQLPNESLPEEALHETS